MFFFTFIHPHTHSSTTTFILSSDSYLSVEKIPGNTTCLATDFLGVGTTENSIIENGTKYSVASSSEAGAGNRYSETVYSIPGTNPCLAIRYFIHYTVFENYPIGSITQFNLPNILSQFDSVRKTLIIQ